MRGVIARLETEAAARERAIDEAFHRLAHLAADRAAFARAVRELPDAQLRDHVLRLDKRPTDLVVWRAVRPEAADPFTTDEES